MGPDLDDPSLAMDGTKCSENSVRTILIGILAM